MKIVSTLNEKFAQAEQQVTSMTAFLTDGEILKKQVNVKL